MISARKVICTCLKPFYVHRSLPAIWNSADFLTMYSSNKLRKFKLYLIALSIIYDWSRTSTAPSCLSWGWWKWKGVAPITTEQVGIYPKVLLAFATYCTTSLTPIYIGTFATVCDPCTNIFGLCILSVKALDWILHVKPFNTECWSTVVSKANLPQIKSAQIWKIAL